MSAFCFPLQRGLGFSVAAVYLLADQLYPSETYVRLCKEVSKTAFVYGKSSPVLKVHGISGFPIKCPERLARPPL